MAPSLENVTATSFLALAVHIFVRGAPLGHRACKRGALRFLEHGTYASRIGHGRVVSWYQRSSGRYSWHGLPATLKIPHANPTGRGRIIRQN